MKINDFEKDISQAILDSAHQYYLEQRVVNLEKVASGLWVAQVHGSETYLVEVQMNRNTIKGWDCDCAFDHGPVCKHVVAMFYGIAEEMGKKKSKSGAKTRQNDQVTQILKKLDKKELEEFLIQQFRSNKGMKNAFLARFAEYLDQDTLVKYRMIVRNLYQALNKQYGYVGRGEEKKLVKQLGELVNKADNLYSRGDVETSIAICKVLIEEVISFLQDVDDSSGMLQDVFERAFEIFSTICESSPPMLKDELFDYLIEEYPKQKYHSFHNGEHFLAVLTIVITTVDQEKKFLNMLEARVKKAIVTDYHSYEVTLLLSTKADFLISRDRKEEALQIAEQYKEYPAMRLLLLHEALANDNVTFALEIAMEGREIAEAAGHWGIVKQWNLEIMELSQKLGDKKMIRMQAEKLYFDQYYGIDYLKIVKDTYTQEEWPEACEVIIAKIRKAPKGYWGSNHVEPIAQIYVMEERIDDLFQLVSKEGNINHVRSFGEYLIKDYAPEVVNMYKSGIRKMAENTGRSSYRDVAMLLKEMQALPGGKKPVFKLIAEFREKYRHRPAMMEIINTKFPDSVKPPTVRDPQKSINKSLGLFDK
jgi:hypothetical protein